MGGYQGPALTHSHMTWLSQPENLQVWPSLSPEQSRPLPASLSGTQALCCPGWGMSGHSKDAPPRPRVHQGALTRLPSPGAAHTAQFEPRGSACPRTAAGVFLAPRVASPLGELAVAGLGPGATSVGWLWGPAWLSLSSWSEPVSGTQIRPSAFKSSAGNDSAAAPLPSGCDLAGGCGRRPSRWASAAPSRGSRGVHVGFRSLPPGSWLNAPATGSVVMVAGPRGPLLPPM